MSVALNTDAVLTEEMLDKVREDLGVERPVTKQWHSEATIDTIRHWAYGLGDDNPLWVDEAHGAASRYGTNIAPPSFLYSTNLGPLHMNSEPSKGSGLPGIHAIWMSDRWQWHTPVRRNTPIAVTKATSDVALRDDSRFAGLCADISTRYWYRDSDGELLAVQDITFMHFGRRVAAGQNKHEGLTRHVWSDEELAGLLEDVEAEVRRGPDDLIYDDVQVGDSIGTVVKGPLTMTEMVTFVQGWGGPFMMASEITHRYLKHHPRANVPDRHMRVPDFPERAHWDGDFARECGFPDGYDFGCQRFGWMLNGITDWAGDNAFVAEFAGRLRGLNIIGDATWCTGTVTAKRIDDDGRRLIDVTLSATNQRGEQTADGTATVVAPR